MSNNAFQEYVTSISALIAKLELLCIFDDIAIAILILFRSRGPNDLSTIFASAVSSIYLLLLALVRQTPHSEIGNVLELFHKGISFEGLENAGGRGSQMKRAAQE